MRLLIAVILVVSGTLAAAVVAPGTPLYLVIQGMLGLTVVAAVVAVGAAISRR